MGMYGSVGGTVGGATGGGVETCISFGHSYKLKLYYAALRATQDITARL